MKFLRHRLTVTPFLTAFFAALVCLPGLNVVNVHASGMGIEYEQPWKRPSERLASAVASIRLFARQMLDRFLEFEQSRWFRPAAAIAGGAVLYLTTSHESAVLAAPLFMGTTLTQGRQPGEFLLGERADGGARTNITVLSGQNLEAGDVVGRVKYGIGRVSIPTVVGTGTGTVTNVFGGPEVEVGSYVMTCTAAVAHGGVFSLTTPSGKTLPSLTMTPGSGGTTNYRSRHLNFTITDSTDFIVGDVFTFVVSTTAPTVIGGTGTGTISALALGPWAKPGNYRVIFVEAISNGGRFQVYRGGPNGGESLGEFLLTAGSTTTSTFETPYFTFSITDATDFIVGNYFDVCVFNQLSGGKVVEWDPTTYDGRHQAAGVLYADVDASAADAAGVIIARDAVVIKDALVWASAITSAQKESAYRDLEALGIIAR